MYAEGYLTGETVNRVNRLTPRQRRQIASLYGKAPKPMGTWEPLPSLTKEETDIILEEFDQQTKVNKATPMVQNHPESSSGWLSGPDRDSHATSHPSHYDTGRANNTNPSRNLSSPSLLQRTSNSAAVERRKPVTESVQTVPPHSLSAQYHSQAYSHSHGQQPPSAPVFYRSSSNWTTPHSTTNERQHHMQLHSQTMTGPSPNYATHMQQCRPPSNNDWTTTYEANSTIMRSQLHPTETLHYTTTDTQNKAPLLSCTTTLNRAPSSIRSSPWTADYQMPSSNNWTRSSESVIDYHSTQLLPIHSTSSCHNYSPQGDSQVPSTSHSISQLSSDLTSLSIALNPSSIEDVSNVDYSLLVVGVTGSGKSSACNFFIGNDVFNTAAGAIAITAKSDAHAQSILGKKVLFIDTPGFGDEFASDEVRMAELGRAILFAREGVNAVVLCMDGSRRFDSSIAQLLKEFEVLGAFWPYTFIMYTHAADMGKTEEEQRFKVSQWLSSSRCPERMKWLFDKVCHRCMTLESKQFRSSAGYYQHKCGELLNMIASISAQNQHQKYTNQFFQWAKRKYDQVKQQKLEHERKLEETQKNLRSYQSIVTLIEADLHQKERQYTEFVTKQQQYISNLEAQLRSCREEERMRIQAQKVQAQRQLTHQTQDHQSVVNNFGAQTEQMLAKYDEDSKQCKEHESQSKRASLELFLDELRYELYASNRERRELSDKLVCMNAQLQKMQEERERPAQKKQESYVYNMAVEGAKIALPTVAKSFCSVM